MIEREREWTIFNGGEQIEVLSLSIASLSLWSAILIARLRFRLVFTGEDTRVVTSTYAHAARPA